MDITWTLCNVRVVPRVKTKLISIRQLYEQGSDVKFGGGKWRVIRLMNLNEISLGNLLLLSVPLDIPRNDDMHMHLWELVEIEDVLVRMGSIKPMLEHSGVSTSPSGCRCLGSCN